jgi:hypothetical protein
MATGSHSTIRLGKEAAAGNSGYLGYYYAGSNNNNNFLSIGLHSNNDLFRVYKNGRI